MYMAKDGYSKDATTRAMEGGGRMIQIDMESLEKLLKFVKEGNEVHMEFEPHRTIIEVMPWKPFEYKCPYKDGEK